MSAGIFVKQGIFVIRWKHCLDIVAVDCWVLRGWSVWSEKCIAWGKCSDLQVFTGVELSLFCAACFVLCWQDVKTEHASQVNIVRGFWVSGFPQVLLSFQHQGVSSHHLPLVDLIRAHFRLLAAFNAFDLQIVCLWSPIVCYGLTTCLQQTGLAESNKSYFLSFLWDDETSCLLPDIYWSSAICQSNTY